MYNDTKCRGERVWDPAGRPVLHMYMQQSISLTLDQLPKTVYARVLKNVSALYESLLSERNYHQ